MSSSAVILFAHGAREPEWSQPLEGIRDRLRAAGTPVELAFLEFMSPSLDEAAARLADKGIESVVIVTLGGNLGDLDAKDAPLLESLCRALLMYFYTVPALPLDARKRLGNA